MLDSLGAPWEVYACWLHHREEQVRAVQEIQSELEKIGYDGRFYSPPRGPERSTLQEGWLQRSRPENEHDGSVVVFAIPFKVLAIPLPCRRGF